MQGGDINGIKQAGLPNIKGSVRLGVGNRIGILDYSNALQGEGSATVVNGISGNSAGGRNDRVILDASKSATIYGSSNTVQPPAISLIPQIHY